MYHSNWDKIINEARGETNVAPGVAGAERRCQRCRNKKIALTQSMEVVLWGKSRADEQDLLRRSTNLQQS